MFSVTAIVNNRARLEPLGHDAWIRASHDAQSPPGYPSTCGMQKPFPSDVTQLMDPQYGEVSSSSQAIQLAPSTAKIINDSMNRKNFMNDPARLIHPAFNTRPSLATGRTSPFFYSQLQGESSSPLVLVPPLKHRRHWLTNPAILSR